MHDLCGREQERSRGERLKNQRNDACLVGSGKALKDQQIKFGQFKPCEKKMKMIWERGRKSVAPATPEQNYRKGDWRE